MNIFFISYNENNCEENWIRLLEFHPDAKRIHGITGINNAHIACNDLSSTDYFWTVDGDNWITKSLFLNTQLSNDLYMFKSIDPIYETATLLGGVKLWRKNSIVNSSMNKGDFSLNATNNKIIVDETFSITRYNTSAYDAWKTSFRHCVKLNSQIFKSRPSAKNLDFYLEQWKNIKKFDNNNNNANWCYNGFCDALEYTQSTENFEDLNLINDYYWLQNYFKTKYESLKKN